MRSQQRRGSRSQKPTEAEAIAIIAGALAVGASPQATAQRLSPPLGVPVALLLPVLLIAQSKPISYGVALNAPQSATVESSNLEATYRAQYVYNATQRLERARRLGTLNQAVQDEQRYFNQHLEAVANRKRAAAQVDAAAARYGNELGWYTKVDRLTSPECAEANGKNFNATRMPAIGYPGAVHPHCRCRAGRKHATSATVYSIKPDRRAA